jgi:glycosyltransferase involved in cell wall biosynthesis
MRILYHHRTQGRGVEGVHIRGLTAGLIALGHEVEVMSVSDAVDGRMLEDESQIAPSTSGGKGGLLKWIAEASPQFVFELLELVFNLYAGVRLIAALRRKRPDIIYERYALFLFVTVWLARMRRIPIVLEVNDSAVVERVRPLGMRGLARAIEGWVFRSATGLVFVSSSFRDLCQAAHGTIAPAVVSPNCADADLFDRARFDRAGVRARLGIEDRVVCGYVGAFIPWHGIDWFVEEIAAQLHRDPRLVLLLVGDGRVFEHVQQVVRAAGAESQVVFTGRVPHQAVPEYIAAMDFAVLPDSNVYGSPMKLFELMAMQVAVIAPDYPPIREVIASDRTGWLFPARDRGACVAQVFTIAQDRVARDSAGRAAADYVRAERQWRHNAAQMLALAGIGGR